MLTDESDYPDQPETRCILLKLVLRTFVKVMLAAPDFELCKNSAISKMSQPADSYHVRSSTMQRCDIVDGLVYDLTS